MSVRREVYQALAATGLKGTETPGWPVGKAPPLPWFVYEVEPRSTHFADDGVWYAPPHVTVDLYSRDRDEELEAKVGAACDALGNLGMEPTHTWLKTESCWVTTFDFTYRPETGE